MRARAFGGLSAAAAALLLVCLFACLLLPVGSAQAEGAEPWYYAPGYLDLGEGGAVRTKGAELAASAAQSGAEDIVIAVIDTGLDLDTSWVDWSAALVLDEGGSFLGYDAYGVAEEGMDPEEAKKQENWQDEAGSGEYASDLHGTKVAGSIALTVQAAGLSEHIKIYPVKAAETGTNKFSVKAVAEAVEHAIEIGADVINLSISSAPKYVSAWETGENAERLKAAISAASEKAIIVAAAGNDGADSADTLYYPAAYEGVVGVMSYGVDGGFYSGSNYGPAYDIAAPGESIWSGDHYTTGTSMAAGLVSAGSAVLMLNAETRALSSGAQMPRATVLSRALISAGDGSVSSLGGAEVPVLDIYAAMTLDTSELGGSYLPVTGIEISGTAGKGSALSASGENALTVQTVREQFGQGKSEVTLTAKLRPYWDADPAEYANIVWTVEKFEKDGEDLTAVAGSRREIGRGEKLTFLFEETGVFKIKAEIAGEGGETFSAEMSFSVTYGQWFGSEAHIVPADFVSSEGYADGSGKVPSEAVCYRSGVSLTITSIEDFDVADVSWYVDGRYAGSGEVFDYRPDSFGEHTVTAYVRLNSEGGSSVPYKITGSFLVDSRSYAEHPYMIPVWCAIGVLILTAVVLLSLSAAKKRAARAAALAAEEGGSADDPVKESPIRKERAVPPPYEPKGGRKKKN